MIGWRVGWVAGPRRAMNRIGLVSIYNVVTPVGIAQPGALAALTDPEGGGVAEAVREWERRRDVVQAELAGLPFVQCDGGWSLLVDTGRLGLEGEAASARLLERGKVAATPMTHWGRENAGQFVRIVFSNEPVERAAGGGRAVQAGAVGATIVTNESRLLRVRFRASPRTAGASRRAPATPGGCGHRLGS